MRTIKQQRRNRQYLIFTAIVALLSLLIAAGVCLAMLNEPICLWAIVGQMLSALAIVCLAWVLISVLYSTVKRGNLIVIGFVTVYILGILAYQGVAQVANQTIQSGVSILSPINNTLSIFFPSRGAYAENNDAHLTLYYQLVHLLSYFFFALIAFSLFGRRLLNRSGHRLIRYKNKNIFWGYSKNGLIMAENILSHTVDDQVVFVLPKDIRYNEEEDNRTFDQINDLSAVALYTDFDAIEPHRHRFSGYRHFFLTDHQDFNVRMALKVMESLALHAPTYKTHLYIRTELENIDVFFQEKLDSLNKEMVEVHIYNHSDLAARQFVSEHPVIKHPAVKINTDQCMAEGEVRVLLLGFGCIGYELLKKMVCDAQFMGDKFNFSVTVVDRDYATKHGRYKYLLKEVCGNENQMRTAGSKSLVEFETHEVGSVEFYDWLYNDAKIMTYNRVIVALGDDELNVNTALELNRFRLSFFDIVDQDQTAEKIFAHVTDYDDYNYYAKVSSPIVLFGGLRKTNCCEVLIDECMDRIAKLVNYVYSQCNTEQLTQAEIDNATGAIECEWATASLFNQNSSRAVALNINNMVLLAGGQGEFVSKLQQDRFLELFAEYEHLRWNAFHFVSGISKWDMGQVTTKNGKLVFGKNILTRHICLVPYDELDAASDNVNSLRSADAKQENYKNSDRRIVRHFPIFLKHSRNESE